MDERRILAGRYELGETIGRGGMAEVHVGYDRRLGRTVAVKVLRSDLARDPAFLNRFRREAQAAAALNHPAIVAVYDTGEEQFAEPGGGVGHVPYIVMEYVEGHTVREVLRDGRPLPPDEAIEIVSGVLSALEYSHRAGIVHRDIKPANVMLTTSGAVKVMDFGIARAVADSQATVTQASAVVGTAQYLSPEQARGEQVDARSDLYSTGCLLFELLTGRPPFVADSMVAVAYQHVREEPPRPSMLNPTLGPVLGDALDRIVHKSLAKEREARYQTAAEFRADLEALVRGGRVSAPPVGAAAVAATQMMAPSQGATTVMAPMRELSSSPPGAGAPPWQAVGVAPEPDPAEEEEEPQRRWWIPVLIGVGVIVAFALVWFLFLSGSGTKAETTAVPNVVGMSADDAEAKLKAEGFDPVRGLDGANEQYPDGQVFSQDPQADAQAKKGSKVTYRVSTGPADTAVPVPDVSGQSVPDATRTLEALDLKVAGPTTEDSATVAKDRVTRTDPASGTYAQKGDQITLYVSSGRITVPDLTGQTKAQADAALNTAGLTGSFSEQEDATATPGTVLSSTPPAGTAVDQHSLVTVVLAKAPTTPTPPPPDQLTVPTGLAGPGTTYATASQKLTSAGFTGPFTQVEVQSDYPAGQVVSVSPSPGSKAAPNATFTINVSLGPAEHP